MIKTGAKINGVQPEILLALIIIQPIFMKENCNLVLTEVTGGKHKHESKHYIGQAVDIRSKNINPISKEIILDNCKIALGENFDFILEGKGTENEHYHLEYDPK